MRQKKSHIPAFTIFEVTLVVAILSILLAIISTSLNRFNEQLKLNSELSRELNEFHLIRSNLWRELVQSDSLELENQHLYVYQSNAANPLVEYRVENEMLERKTNADWEPINLAIESFAKKEEDSAIVFNFIWKNEIMKLSYKQQSQLKTRIDAYFQNLE